MAQNILNFNENDYHHSSSAANAVETIRNMYARATGNLRFHRKEWESVLEGAKLRAITKPNA